jgi:serine/threonine-protein kinase HipA
MLADALPDDFGNALIDAWMATKGIEKSATSVLDRLAYMGKRGMGALEFRPAREAHTESSAPIKIKQLFEKARRLVQGSFAVDHEAKAALANIIKVGASAGGARAKAVLAWSAHSDEVRSGQFDTASGSEHWLLKFDGVGKDKELGTGEGYGRIEYAYHLMAKEAGVVMPPCRLPEENGRAHFMTKRFDREEIHGKTHKHHLQTLCAMNYLDFLQRGRTPTSNSS